MHAGLPGDITRGTGGADPVRHPARGGGRARARAIGLGLALQLAMVSKTLATEKVEKKKKYINLYEAGGFDGWRGLDIISRLLWFERGKRSPDDVNRLF